MILTGDMWSPGKEIVNVAAEILAVKRKVSKNVILGFELQPSLNEVLREEKEIWMLQEIDFANHSAHDWLTRTAQ